MEITAERQALRAALGRVGVYSFALERVSASAEREAAAEIEALGYPALWVPESVGSKEVFSQISLLLSATSEMVVASGIANIWARDPYAMANGARTLADAFPGRFVLGVGVSHAPSVEVRGGSYASPLARMRTYLDQMDRARYDGPPPERPPPRLLAALGPKMLELAGRRAAGAHPYFAPPEHTALARATLGREPVLAVELTCVLEGNATDARAVCRAFAEGYLELPNYFRNLRRMGFSEEDLSDGGSDRVVDAVFAWGDADAIARKVRMHLDAGADHVCVQLRSQDRSDVCIPQLRELAPALMTI